MNLWLNFPIAQKSIHIKYSPYHVENKDSKQHGQDSRSTFDEQEIQRAIKASQELENAEDKTLQRVLAQSFRDVHGFDGPFYKDHEQNDSDMLNQQLIDKAIAASLVNDTSSVNNDNTITNTETSMEPSLEGKLFSLKVDTISKYIFSKYICYFKLYSIWILYIKTNLYHEK